MSRANIASINIQNNPKRKKEKNNRAVMSLAMHKKEINCSTSLLLNESPDRQSIPSLH